MPKKAQKPDESIGQWNGIANVVVQDEHKKLAKELADGTDTAWLDDFQDLLAGDYKLVIRWDDRSDCPQASLSCYDADSPNYKRTLVTRAPKWLYAVALTLIKHRDICNGDWTQDDSGETWS